jgi:hypothetical protein
MTKFAGFLSLIAGLVVLVGEYVASLKSYYLVPIGAAVAIIAGIIAMRRPY